MNSPLKDLADRVEKRARQISPMGWFWHDKGLNKIPKNAEVAWLYSLNKASDECREEAAALRALAVEG